MFTVRRPKPSILQKLLAHEEAAAFTYLEVGATAGVVSKGPLPAGYVHDRRSVVIGEGEQDFRSAAAFLHSWGLQRSMGFDVFPTGCSVVEGLTVLLGLPVVGTSFISGARVVYVVEQPTEYGFAYGTLPSHPEVGEEYFGVRVSDQGNVSFEIVAFSRPRAFAARCAKPVTRMMQLSALRRYTRLMSSGIWRTC